MAISGTDWVGMVREASKSPLGIVALAVIVMLFVTLGIGPLPRSQKSAVVISVVCLVGLFVFLVLQGPVAPSGGSICLLRNTTLSRANPTELPGTAQSIGLINTQVGRNGPQPRGATIALSSSANIKAQFVVEGGHDEVYIDGRTYEADVSAVMENTIVLSLCRTT
jgi:hypothetical protein